MSGKTRKEANADKTRAALLAAARKLFAQSGYARTGTEDIVRLARVTRGALYHHFRDKQALFDAVVEREEERLAAAVAQAARAESDAWRGLGAGCYAFLEACRDPVVRQIVVLDGPMVLGAERERSLAEHHHLSGIRSGLRRAIQSGAIDPVPVDAMAQALLGALTSAAQYASGAADQAGRLKDANTAVGRLLGGLAAAKTRP